nr:FxsA family protein [Govania unica]
MALPFAEIAMFIVVGRAIGLWATLGLIILSMVVGLMIVRAQGLAQIVKLRSSLKKPAAKPMVASMLHSLMLAVAGILFLIPGFLTDILAILLLVPPIRTLLGLWMLKNMTVVSSSTTRAPLHDDIIEGEFTETDDQNIGPRPILPARDKGQDSGQD